jgi:hypothetical protein
VRRNFRSWPGEPDGVVTRNQPLRLPNGSYQVLVGNACCRPMVLKNPPDVEYA